MKQPIMDSLRFPGGKTRALTFSYDDGVLQDRRLVGILNDRGLRGTFNIGSGVLGYVDPTGLMTKLQPEEIAPLYAGHEIASHGLYHSAPTALGGPAALYEIIEDRRRLEELSGGIVRGFAYPYGAYDASVKQLLAAAGMAYARVVPSSGNFALPTDFLEWMPTAHHNDEKLMDLAKAFCGEQRFPHPALFYLWGHSYEFDQFDNWHVIEEFTDYVAQFDQTVWFATNIEIHDYIQAYRQLIYSADAGMIYNPTATHLWMARGRDTFELAPGATVRLA